MARPPTAHTALTRLSQQGRKGVYRARLKGKTVVVKARPQAAVQREAEVLRLMAMDARSHAVAIVCVHEDFEYPFGAWPGDDEDEELGALVTEYAPKSIHWDTGAEARQITKAVLEVPHSASGLLRSSSCCSYASGMTTNVLHAGRVYVAQARLPAPGHQARQPEA